jgi:HlyD family secretion protein
LRIERLIHRERVRDFCGYHHKPLIAVASIHIGMALKEHRMKSRQRFVHRGRIGLVIIAGALALSACTRPGSPAGSGAAQRTATVEKGSMTATVSATGNIQPESDVRLNFQTAGTVAEVNVKVGDRVKKGALIAKLDTTDLELALTQARGALEQAQASAKQSQNALATADTSIEQARNQIVIATAAYSKTIGGVRSADVVAAQAAYDAAVASFDKVQAGPTREDLAAAEAGIRNAETALRQAQTAYDAAFRFNPAAIGASPASAQLETATNNYNSAKAQYDKAAKGADSAQLASARQQIENARANLARTRTPVLSFDVDQAKAQIDQARLQLKNAETQRKNSDSQIALAEIQVRQAELQVKQAERRLAQTQLTAPSDGIIAAVNVDVGEASTTVQGAPFTLVDDSKFHIDITVDEIDIAKIKVDQEVVVTLDSLPGVEVKGKVERIAPTSTTINGVVSYSVRVLVEQSAEVQLRAGMTANAAIVLDRRNDVLLAPNWAVRRDRGSGKAFLTFKTGETTSEREIKLGLRNDTSSEILSGANAGDTIVAPTAPSPIPQS